MQALALSDAELQWLCDHLGHSKPTHLGHYRNLSASIERAQIGKIMLIQDLGLTGDVRGKSLQDEELNGV